MATIKEEVSRIYAETIARVNALIDGLKASNAQNDVAIRKDVDAQSASIEKDNERLKQLVDELYNDSEFEKYTIAFFGETNAEKSTIIEALCILFSEKSREQTIEDNKERDRQWREEHRERCRNVIRVLCELKQQYSPQSQSKRRIRLVLALILVFVAGVAIGIMIAVWSGIV